MLRSRRLLAAFLVLLLGAPALAHGGGFRGPRGGTPPGLPTQPSAPEQSGGGTHTWLTWWGYNQFKYTDFRRRQEERRGPVSGSKDPRAEEEDPNAWREGVRSHLTPLLVEALKDDDEEVRTSAAVALGKWRATVAIPDLRRVQAKDDIRQVREAAVLGLILMRDHTLRDYFIQLASKKGQKQEELRVRGFALLGLGLLGDAKSRAFLLGLLDPKNKKARRNLPTRAKEQREYLCAAVAALTQVKGVDLSAEFVRMAGEKRLPEEVRGWAVNALGKTGATSALKTVVEILKKSKIEQMRRSAAMAIGSLADRTHTDAIDALADRLKRDRDKIVKHFATLSLGRIGGPKAYAILNKAYRSANKETRGFIIIAFGLSKEPGAGEKLAKIMKAEKDPVQQAAAALALGLLDDDKLIPPVRETFLQAKAWTLMQATMLSLGILNDQSSADRIKEILITKRQPTVRTSAAISYALLRQWAALPVLVDILRSAKTIVTLSAISQVMGFLSSPRAVEPLVELYKNKTLQRQARAFALVAIGALGDQEPFPLLVRLGFDINYLIRSDAIDEAVTIL